MQASCVLRQMKTSHLAIADSLGVQQLHHFLGLGSCTSQSSANEVPCPLSGSDQRGISPMDEGNKEVSRPILTETDCAGPVTPSGAQKPNLAAADFSAVCLSHSYI